MLLSFIVPFFNSEKKSKRLLKTLSNIDQDDIEIILIDDGSTDDTYKVLNDFKINAINKNVKVIQQENKGPGGARNAGLKIANGKYVWFVDSDDDIKVEAIDVVRQNFEKEYDFIDFNITSLVEKPNSMSIDAGEYPESNNYSILLLKQFGRICSKAFRRKFLIDNDIYYPEYCFYEDNPLTFIYPFFVKSFLKVELVGYVHNLEFESITRSKINLRTFDRFYTTEYGYKKSIALAKNSTEVKYLKNKFTLVYLFNTTAVFLSIAPSKNWIVTWRAMKEYRKLAKKFNIDVSVFTNMKDFDFSINFKSYFMFHWILSFLIIEEQTEYFDAIRKKAWN